MTDKAYTVGDPGYGDSTARNYPPFKPPEESGAKAAPTLAELQAPDSRDIAKGKALPGSGEQALV